MKYIKITDREGKVHWFKENAISYWGQSAYPPSLDSEGNKLPATDIWCGGIYATFDIHPTDFIKQSGLLEN